MSAIKKDGSSFFLKSYFLLPFALIVWIIIWYHPTLYNYWLFDDPTLLKFAILYNPADYLFKPAAYTNLNLANFTPWLGLSLDLDWSLFGLSPYGFYLHHLISVCLLAVRYERNTFSWEAGPYASGQYSILFSPPKTRSIRDIGTRGSWFEPVQDGIAIPKRLRYISPEGWRTYSPLIYFKKEGPKVDLRWQR